MIHLPTRLPMRSLFVTLLLAFPIPTALLGAQIVRGDSTADGRTVVVRDTQKVRKTLFTHRDAALAAGFAGLTIAMFPLDRRIADELVIEETAVNSFLDRAAKGVEYITTPGSFYIGGALYVTGKMTKNRNLQDLGWHGTEAVLLSSVTTSTLKGIFGRARPDFAEAGSARDFKAGSGFGNDNRKSFPSGHATTAFAAASAVTSEVNRLWPKYTWYVGPVLYGGATLVGLSRMYHNRHWASDVVLGAAIGTFSGLKVVRYSHAHPDNKIDRIILGLRAIPDFRGGGALAMHLELP